MSHTLISDDARNRHDLKNQLAIIAGFTEILLDDASNADQRRDLLTEIQRAAAAALNLLARVFPADHGLDAPGLN